MTQLPVHSPAPEGELAARVLAALADLARALYRLDAHAAAYGSTPPPAFAPGLTAPDQPSGEQWDAGQLWAHIAEFGSYWLPELERILDCANAEPVPFGRVKTQPHRIAEIERNRALGANSQISIIRADIARYHARLAVMSHADWQRRGIHSTLGEMTVWTFLDHFVTGHYHEHADQLDELSTTPT